MKWVIRDREDDQLGPDFRSKEEAVENMKFLRLYDRFAPYRLIRLETRREKVIRVMRALLSEPDGSYSPGYVRATVRWLGALSESR